jgi:glutamate-1-semialdehyde 2,1-aminomutase
MPTSSTFARRIGPIRPPVSRADQPEEELMTSLPTAARQPALQARALQALAGGVSSNTRLLNPHLIVERASGCRIWDADGTEYIDYLLGQGPNFLGYAPQRVVEKVLTAQLNGVIYAATHVREIEAAERVLEVLGWAETMRFGSSSTEMVQAALRMARAATGRALVVRFHGHYHGWTDNIYTRADGAGTAPGSKGQPASALRDVITIEWNDAEAFEQVMSERGSEVAAVIMEPVMLNAGVIVPEPGYLETVRRVCQQRGTVLIFDETISGFRVALGGAAERYGVHPDLAVYGKAMAAGWPCAAIAGKRDLFADVATGAVTHAGTFNGNTIATAAVLASIDELASGEVYEQVGKTGAALMQAIRDAAEASGLGLHVQGLPMAFHASFAEPGRAVTRFRQLAGADAARYGRLADVLIAHGVWVARRGIWYVSAAHTEADIDESAGRIGRAFEAFRTGG